MMQTLPHNIALCWHAETGLRLTWRPATGLPLVDVPVRLALDGARAFFVWGMVDSGEGAPAWAEADFRLTLFGAAVESPETRHTLETILEGDVVRGYRAIARHARVEAVVEFRLADDVRVSVQLRNPQPLGGKRLPVCAVELQLENIATGAEASFVSAHAYGGRTHGVGRVGELVEPGMPFHHGTIGLGLPLVYLHQPERGDGVQFEFLCEGRPTAWVRPGVTPDCATFVLAWLPQRLLLPGQAHAFGGELGIHPFRGCPVAMMRAWRDGAEARLGLRLPPRPAWVKQTSTIELHLFPGAYKEFTRLDDPGLYAILKRWREIGYDSIMAVAPNHTKAHWLSPLDYFPVDAVGGLEAERVMLGWMHELGFHVGLWVTTVGLDKTAKEVAEHREWWTLRANQELFYAWDSTPATDFVGYAPDGDPLSTGWRDYLRGQVTSLLGRGWDGIYVDGCIPRADNHARWCWPGESRNAVEDQAAELAALIQRLNPDAILTDEDGGLAAQVTTAISTGRYTPMTPFFKKAYWDHGMGGGPAVLGDPPARIPPELAGEYLRIRYASLLPGAISQDGIEGYCGEEARPWTVQTLLAGPTSFKTHAEYINDPLTFRQLGDAPPAGPLARDPDRRRRGHEEFLRLLKFRETEPLIHADVPLSLDGVLIEGDDAVVGLLRPTADRCLLVLIQFADRPAEVRVRLAAPDDVPAVQRAVAGHPDAVVWQARERLRSIANDTPAAAHAISGTLALPVTLGAYGFRVFELMPMG